ncbi:MAG TPA: DUF4012 domain-containing protein, partial [Actinomycetota bacterium]|nr:DUF4012 domain-containing protein [Actinomycetota bacterium]
MTGHAATSDRETPAAERERRHRSRRRRRRRTRIRAAVRAAVVAIAGGLAALGAGFAWETYSAYASLQRAEPMLASARAAARDAKPADAGRALREAHPHVRAAVSRASGPFTGIVAAVPVAGRSARGVRAGAEAAELAVRAGLGATAAAEAFPTRDGGIASFGFVNGRIPVEAWRDAAAPLEAADELARRALARVHAADRSLILPPLARALSRLDEDLTELRKATGQAASLATVIPALAGGEGRKRYLLAFQNPAELRATGGLLGGVALLDANAGVIEITDTLPDNDLRPLEQAPVKMPDWYVTRYERLRGMTIWQNVNMEPHFPVSAPLIAGFYRATTGTEVDGVIALDPFALSAMLEA